MYRVHIFCWPQPSSFPLFPRFRILHCLIKHSLGAGLKLASHLSSPMLYWKGWCECNLTKSLRGFFSPHISLQLRSEGPWHARKWQSFRGWSDWHHLSSLLPCHRRSPTVSPSPIQCLDRVILNCDGHQELLSKKLITWRFDPPNISQEIPKKWKRPQHHSCGCLTARTAMKKDNFLCIQKALFSKNSCLTINYQKSKTYSHRETIFPSQSIPHLDQVELDLAPLGAPPRVAWQLHLSEAHVGKKIWLWSSQMWGKQ